ncbi:hypothetical protein CS388_03435 [Porphyromonas gingivalis]|nr:hypothetical protein CS545_08905 [Porphyromonas gingivalis]ATS08169.1 hypothetical protein CS388_03435 [Porphyromonas gingivalis]
MRNPHFDRNIHPANMPKSILYAAKNTTSEGKKKHSDDGLPPHPNTESNEKRTAIRYSGSPYVEVYLIRSKRLSEANRSFSAEKPERY